MNLSALESLRSFALLGPGFTGDGFVLVTPLSETRVGRVWFQGFDDERPRAFSGAVERVSPAIPPGAPLDVTLDDSGFLDGVGAIREAIAKGDVYQVNLTVRTRVQAASGAQVFSALCRRGVPRFAAWVRLPDGPEFVSASPELLVELDGRSIHVEPMKGTAPPGQRAWLETSEKDRAELAMITDLLRDDLQPLCVPGSVTVPSPRRFLELPYAVQAVSDVKAELRAEVGLREVLARVQPGGSVTGAPRPAALRLIRALEKTPRGVYCGTLGWTEGRRAVCSLLIRTAERVGPGEWQYGVGGGITWDSSPEAELAEVKVKLGALAG